MPMRLKYIISFNIQSEIIKSAVDFCEIVRIFFIKNKMLPIRLDPNLTFMLQKTTLWFFIVKLRRVNG
ncbi:hypothetical protein CVP04_07615 [Caviibacterium pharyngocola]|uniref:Uncharacterized protein n=1 Tax=Caviibacterium pharyngocola TaxID=28159 RepID=A0A2M8RUT9_9PAST|nr:hypothetical protein CVP04_07615 [Caviibacterium pharyngocola]